MKIQIKKILSIAAIVLSSYEASACDIGKSKAQIAGNMQHKTTHKQISDLGKSYIKLQWAENMAHKTTHKKLNIKEKPLLVDRLGLVIKLWKT